MRKITLLLFILLLGTIVSLGQITALFVNDNSIDEVNTETIYKLLEQNLGTLPYFDAVDSARSPRAAEMEPYKLVIWYCGADEDDLYIWNNNHQDNPFLMEYLDNGGSLWTIGSGFLNARYIKPPREFKDGTFLNDYLGVTKWSAETYTDDDGFGVPELVIKPGTPVNTLTLNIVNWEVPPERFVDCCELVEGCFGAYICGPNTYMFHGEITAFYYSDNFENMTFTFDPYAMDSQGDMNVLLSDILRFYEEILSDVDETNGKIKSLKLYPNPALDILNIEFALIGEGKVLLIDILGNVLRQKYFSSTGNSLISTQLSVSDIPGGVYFLRVESPVGVISKSVVLAK